MNCRLYCLSLALTVFAALGLFQPCPSLAQQPPKDQVPFKFTMTADGEASLIPANPPILSIKLTGTAQATPLGQYTFVAHKIGHLGVDGLPITVTDGVGAFTTANGDAIFITFSGLVGTTSDPKVFDDLFAFTITGGQGRFVGTTGSGTMHDQVKIGGGSGPGKDLLIQVFDGTISAPKP